MGTDLWDSLGAVTPGETLGTLYTSGVGFNKTKQHGRGIFLLRICIIDPPALVLPALLHASYVYAPLQFNKHCPRGWIESPHRDRKLFACFYLSYSVPRISTPGIRQQHAEQPF